MLAGHGTTRLANEELFGFVEERYMMDDIRTEPGIRLSHLFFNSAISVIAVITGHVFWLVLAVYLWFNSIVGHEFFPNLTDEEIAEIRRQQWMERKSRKDDGRDKDLREGPPKDSTDN